MIRGSIGVVVNYACSTNNAKLARQFDVHLHELQDHVFIVFDNKHNIIYPSTNLNVCMPYMRWIWI